MEPSVSKQKKLKSPGVDATANINIKTSVTCSNVPEALFDSTTAKKHFSKFGRVLKIRLLPKKSMCIIEYDQPLSAERAVLNAGAFDGFMFDVSRTKARVRKHSKRDDPDWVPDADVASELSAMSGAPTYRISRQKPMDVEIETKHDTKPRPVKANTRSPLRSSLPIREKKSASATMVSQPLSGTDTPIVTSHTSLNTSEAALELHQLRSKVSLTADDKWRILDSRDRILRAWGGAGSRVSVGGATIGTCPDMCPEKELIHRQAEHQVMTLETVPGSDGEMEPWRAVKQYSRSSADQEIPMCYELRPPHVLMRTTAYLLHEIADTKRQISLADWFHFLWDRLRGIRKDITQQALCCTESVWLVEMCARFHAHCAARLADLEYTQFDQKLNTDNLTKCLQTLKHMYHDVKPEDKPREAEFRGYVALLNLGDANFWWEIQQLPAEIQKSEDILFAIKIFNALDNNNYVQFFRLVKEKATYLQACILLRYFNDVRARALARIVKAYAPRGQSKYPAKDLMNSLAFESLDCMRAFVNHYGLRFGKDETELVVILDRNQFIEDSDPYPIARSINLIESKRHKSVGEVIAGGTMPSFNYDNCVPYTSFTPEGRLKESALTATDQGYDTRNDSNKDIGTLKTEIQRLSQGGRLNDRVDSKPSIFLKPVSKTSSPGKSANAFDGLSNDRSSNIFSAPTDDSPSKNLFSFKPAIAVAPPETIKQSPEQVGHAKSLFSFSKPQETPGQNLFAGKENPFKSSAGNTIFNAKPGIDNHLFRKEPKENKDPNEIPNAQSFQFKKPEETNLFRKPGDAKPIFGQTELQLNKANSSIPPIFGSSQTKTIFGKNNESNEPVQSGSQNVFSAPNNVPAQKTGSIFSKPIQDDGAQQAANVFGSVSKFNHFSQPKNIFEVTEKKSVFAQNGNVTEKLSPGTLFKSASSLGSADGQSPYTIFQSKNKPPSVADNIFNSVNSAQSSVYDFDQNDNEIDKQQEMIRQNEDVVKEMERQVQEKLREEERQKQLLLQEQERQKEIIRQEQERYKEQERKKQEELKRLEDMRLKEEAKKQEELKKKLEEDKRAELKRKAEEEYRKFKERVENESLILINELVKEIENETLREILQIEIQRMKEFMAYAGKTSEDICKELCDEICYTEMKAEKFYIDKMMKKWFRIWRTQYHRNMERRCLLEDTPVWLTDTTPMEFAARVRRNVEQAALKNMNDIHRGYKFTGELSLIPPPESYNIMDIIRSPLLKRMKQIRYPYDKCFFWKLAVISPGTNQWLCRKIEIEKWIIDAFSDKQKHDTSETLIRVEKQSWNQLMDFAISVSLANPGDKNNFSEALEGANGLLFYITESDNHFLETIDNALKQKFPYQVIPVAVIMSNIEDTTKRTIIENSLTDYANKHIISYFKLFCVNATNIAESLNASTKSAMKWLAKKYPQTPPLELDLLKSICQRYLGNEIWLRLKTERDSRMKVVLKDIYKLVSCYNVAVDKLEQAITNEDVFNYPCFPLEFKDYLDHNSPYPKPYEFVPANAKTSENASAIRDFLVKLKLPRPGSDFLPVDVSSMQEQIRSYCNEIQWFEKPEEVVCKVVALLPNQFSDLNMSGEDFCAVYEKYDLIDFLRIVVYEKIRRLNMFDNRFAVYEKSALENYRDGHWLHELEVLASLKHKALEYEDELDMLIEAKRRKTELDSMEYLMLEDKDSTMVEESLNATNQSISRLSNCTNAVKQLEEQIDRGRQKSMDLDNLLKSALSNV